MTSYRMRLTDRQRKIGRSVHRAQRALLKAFEEEKATNGVTQQSIADKLGVDRSVVHRRLSGEANLTLRIIAEMAWAMGRDFDLAMPKPIAGTLTRSASHWSQCDFDAPPSRVLDESLASLRLALAEKLPNERVEFVGNDNWQPMSGALAAA